MPPHGTPDWGHIGPKSTTYGLDDLAELAVRLGSPVMWDRRGDVIQFDTFDGGFGQVEPTAYGDNSDIFLSPDATRLGGLAACIKTDGGKDRSGQLGYPIPMPAPSKLGAEFCFSSPEGCEYYGLMIHWYTGQIRYSATIIIEIDNGKLFYLDVDGGEEEFEKGLAFYNRAKPSNTAKLVGDFVDFQYVRFILNETTYDLSDYPLQKTEEDYTMPQVIVTIFVKGKAEAYIYHFVDSVIVTQNEP